MTEKTPAEFKEKELLQDPDARSWPKMASGNSRYLRYILFAFFGIAVIYFLSSSSIPTASIPNSPWNNPASSSLDSDKAVKKMPQKQVDSQATEASLLKEELAIGKMSTGDHPWIQKPMDPSLRMNATFVTLARNGDVWEIAKSIRHIEDRFNHKFGYDWVFLNDQPFDDNFKKVTTSLVTGKTHYGLIGKEHWSFPEWIDEDKAAKVREDMAERKIIYGDSISYRHMCRYESGFFFQHPIMHRYEWYWRVEPSVEVFCDLDYDPFRFMAENKKKYSFVLSLYEYVETIPTLWDSVKKFMREHPEHIADDNSMAFLSDDGGDTYNHCHMWSNFEIGNLNWLRGPAYTDYFKSLDRDGGFFYERWGDAPVHSIGAGLLLNKDEIHFFNDIAYYHVPFTHCPTGDDLRLKLRCHCDPKENFDWKGYSCTSRFFEINGMKKPEGYEDQQ